MKIIMFGQKGMPSREGGIEVAVQELSVRMAERGHEVLCCNRWGKNTAVQKEYRGVQLRRMPTLQRKGLAAVSSAFFAALYSSFADSDIVHIHGEGPAFFAFLPKLAGKRIVVSIHGLDWAREKWKGSFASRFLRWGEQTAVHTADEIIVLSESAEAYFLKQYQRKTQRIPNGCVKAEPLPAREISKQFGLEQDSYLLFLGRLVPEKGLHHLIQAFREVQTEKKLVIAGESSDSDDYVKRLHELAGGDERILFTGFVEGERLRELYSNCYLYVLPSSLEGMPLTLLEALGYGNCCVVSDIPECREVVKESGICVPPGNTDELQSCLQRLCDHASEVKTYRQRALDRCVQFENWETVTVQTLKLYETLLRR